jgi:hypothetical protein
MNMITKFYLIDNRKQQTRLINRLKELIKNDMVFTNQHNILMIMNTTEEVDDIIRADCKIKKLYLKAYRDVIWWDENEYQRLMD